MTPSYTQPYATHTHANIYFLSLPRIGYLIILTYFLTFACPRVRLDPPVHSLILDWPLASRLLHHVRLLAIAGPIITKSLPETPPRVPAKSNMRIPINTISHLQYYLHVPYGLSPLPVWFLKTIKFKSTSLILLLGSSLVPFSQSLLPPSHIGLPFSVPRLCTIKTGLFVCDIWVYLRVVDVARLHWVSIWFRFPLAHGLVHSFLVILVVVNSMDLVYIEQIPFHARSLRHPVDCN